ncbi:hypothetical protein MBLNU230_g1400t1 [Neophaeotheca triangularis]
MALPAQKKRKTEHVTSDEESDEGSFASFGDSGQDAVDGAGQSSEEEEDDRFGNDNEEEPYDESMDDEAGAEDVEDAPVRHAAQSQKIAPKTQPRKPETGGAYTGGNFKSNAFKLQVDELLEQIRPKHGAKEAAIDEALHSLRTAIGQIPAREPLPVEDAERALLKEKVVTPFPQPRPPKDAKYKLAYAKPANINVAGSYILNTSSRTKPVVEADMVVTMPSSLFQEKDYLNLRYFYKRAYYLGSLAAGLKSSQKGIAVEYGLLHDDSLRPILIARPVEPKKGKDSKPAPKWQINIILSVGSDVFSPEKLQPHKNCVRESDQSAEDQSPTPRYNASLRSDMLVASYLKLLHATANSCSAFRDVCLLGSTWLRQRGFGANIPTGGFGNFEWSALIAILLQSGGPGGKPMLSEGYSSYQLFKANLQLLASKDLSKQAFIVGGEESTIKPLGDGFPIVWDGARQHNLLFKMTPSSYRLLRHEAQSTLKMLNDQLFDGFESTFIRRIDHVYYRYDTVMQLPALSAVQKSQKSSEDAHAKLYEVLKRGLGDRTTLVSIQPPAVKSWPVNAAKPASSSDAVITVGFAVNPENVSRTVDHGPSADSKAEAASFRQFWGEKAELRRFKDGSIHESLIWAGEGEHTVLEQVVRYVLWRHFGTEPATKATFSGNNFANLLRQPHGTAPYQPIMEAFKKLESDIRGLDGMPLTVRQISPADSQLCYSSVAPPGSPGKQPRMPANCVIQFEGSGRWPDDLQAIQRTKIAFLLKTSELLHEANNEIESRIGLENEDRDILNQAYLDITYSESASFRLRIHHEREQTLLERQVKSPTIDPRSKELAATGLAAYKRGYIAAPAHTQALARLCNHHQALSGSIRLLKKWFASHLLQNHFAPALIELLAAQTFTQPWPYSAPATPQIAFLRTLAFLARWDWRTAPLIVNLSPTGSDNLTPSTVQTIRTNFEAWRSVDPALNRLAIFAASSVDTSGATWTDNSTPAPVVAGRMSALARAACSEIEAQALHLQPEALFNSPLSDFDFTIHLNPTAVAGGKKTAAKKQAFKNLDMEATVDSKLLGFDPAAAFLSELEVLYGQSVLFFSGGGERAVLAGLWMPGVQRRRGWKVNLAFNTRPVLKGKEEAEGTEVEAEAEVNREAVLSEIGVLGGELVRGVELRG